MTITALGQLIANIIESYMSLPSERVILKNEGFDAPKDQGIYVLVDYDGSLGIVAITSKKNPATNTETMSVTTHERFAIEVVSKGRDSTDRHKEVLMALQSIAGIQAADDAGCSIWRSGQVLDLSAIEGASSLRRYRIPVIISNIETKTSSAIFIDKITKIGMKDSSNGETLQTEA